MSNGYHTIPTAPIVKPLRANRIEAGRTYYPQGRPDCAFRVLWISAIYFIDEGKTSISNHRKAIAVDAQGYFYMQAINGNGGWFEVKGE